MCYIIEFIDEFNPAQNFVITVKTLSHVHVKELNVYVTAKYDYLGLLGEWGENRPLKIKLPLIQLTLSSTQRG